MKTKPDHKTISPLLGLFIGILAVSTASIFVRFAQEESPSLVIAAYRLTLSSLVLAPVAFFKHRKEISRLSRRDVLLALASGFFLALHFAAWISSLEYTSVASSVVLVATIPLWVMLLSPFTIKESISRLMLLGMAIALAGGVIVGLSDTCQIIGWQVKCPPLIEFIRGKAFWGDALALTGAIMAACYMLIGRRLRVRMSLITYIFLVYSMAAIVLIIIMFMAGHQPYPYSARTYLWFVLLALVPQLLGHTSFNWALKYLSAVYVSISVLGEPVGSTILAYIVLHETPGGLKIFGAILILAGIYLASKSEKEQINHS
ncbi:MAG: DMT family transporter [Anaerolineales bacterium]|nr:DMT family transporter [Anaerolineales bacterium]